MCGIKKNSKNDATQQQVRDLWIYRHHAINCIGYSFMSDATYQFYYYTGSPMARGLLLNSFCGYLPKDTDHSNC